MLTMYTQQAIDKLRALLSDTIHTAADQGDWDLLGNLSQAQKIWNEAKPGSNLDALISQVEDLIGHDLVVSALEGTKSVAIESPIRAQAASSEPSHRHEPSAATLPAPSGETDRPDLVAEPLPPGRTPSVQPRQLDSADQERLNDRLKALRRLLDNENKPSSLDEVPKYASQLRSLMNDVTEIATESLEARDAAAQLALLYEIVHVAETVEALERRIEIAAESLDLDAANTVRSDARNLPLADKNAAGQFTDDRFNKYERAFPVVAVPLARRVSKLHDIIELRRTKIGTQLFVYVTRATVGTKEELEKALDELTELEHKGVRKVPDEKGETIDRASAWINTKSRLIELCHTEASRLLHEGNNIFIVYQEATAANQCEQEYSYLQTVRERCETGLTFTRSRHFGPGDLKEEAEKLNELLNSVNQRLTDYGNRARSAQEWYDAARRMEDPIAALSAILNAERLFPCLTGLSGFKTTLLETVASQLRRELAALIQETNLMKEQRRYNDARGAVATLHSRLDVLPSTLSLVLGDLRLQSQQLEPMMPMQTIQDLRAWLNAQAEAVQQEQIAWDVFQARIERIRHMRPEVTESGTLSEVWLVDLERQFSVDDLKRFAREWEDVKDTLATNAGASAAFERARVKFDNDPLDKEIGNLLEGIGAHDPHFAEAQRLLRRHRTHVRLEDAKARLRYPASTKPDSTDDAMVAGVMGLTDAPETWLRGLRTALWAVQVDATEREDQPLLEEAAALEKAGSTLYRLQEVISDYIIRGEFPSAYQSLDHVAGTADLAMTGGLRWLRELLRRRWRQAYLDSIAKIIISDPNLGYRAVPNTTANDLKRAAGYIEELENVGFTEDGDGPLAAGVRRLWHRAAIKSILGVELAKATENEIAQLARQRSMNWRELLEHLQGLLGSSGSLDINERQIADKLRVLTLGYYTFNQPRTEAINYLQSVRQSRIDLYDDPVLCSMLTLRLLEQPDGNEQASKLVSELQASGRSARQLAEALNLIVAAFGFHNQGNLELAVDTIESGTEQIKEIVPDFGLALDEALNDTKAQWRKSLGEALLKDASSQEGTVEGIATFAVLQTARRAEQLLPQDRRAKSLVDRLYLKAERATDELQEAVDRWLDDSPRRLQDSIDDGRRLRSYLREALGPDYKPTPGRVVTAGSAKLQALGKSFGDVQEQLDLWEKAQRDLQVAQTQFRQLLNGDWRWNDEPRRTPNRELTDVLGKLRQAGHGFAVDPPLEFQGLYQLVEGFEKAVHDITPTFEAFRSNFEGDDYKSDRDFTNAKTQLGQLRVQVEASGRTLRDLAHKAGWGGGAINLDRFFIVHDHYGRPQLIEGHWAEGQAQDLHSLIQASDRLEERRHNWQKWQGWTQRTAEQLDGLHDSLDLARKALQQGQLTKARELLRDDPASSSPGEQMCIPKAIGELEKQQRTIPEPPICQLAANIAHNPPGFQPDPESSSESLRSWEQLRQAARLETAGAWQHYLGIELTEARRQLEALHATVDQKALELGKRIKEMNDHVRHHKKPSLESQAIYADLLGQVMAIDRDDPEVMGHQTRYDGRQRILNKR